MIEGKRFEPAAGHLMVKVPPECKDCATSVKFGEVVRGGTFDNGWGPSYVGDKVIPAVVQWDYFAPVNAVEEDGETYVVIRLTDVIGGWVRRSS